MAWGLGLGRSMTRFGRWLDSNGITQGKLEAKTGISETTITRLCRDINYKPTERTKMMVITTLQRMDYDVEIADFW
jgi:uncharacterized protein YerC